MPQVFDRRAKRLPFFLFSLAIVIFASVIALSLYYNTPLYTDVGYRPAQPVPFSHRLHAGDLGMDCRYCHHAAEFSFVAGVPSTQICLNCHRIIGTNSEKLAPVRESYATSIPIGWLRIHKTPDYAYFDHHVHVRVGISCYSCHGDVAAMEKTTQEEPLSMLWCLDCHRHPEKTLQTDATTSERRETIISRQEDPSAEPSAKRKISPPIDCTGCHR